jgi:hypothetical protein
MLSSVINLSILLRDYSRDISLKGFCRFSGYRAGYKSDVVPQAEAVKDMFLNGFCDLHKQQIAANDIALPNVMNHVIASTANRYLYRLQQCCGTGSES